MTRSSLQLVVLVFSLGSAMVAKAEAKASPGALLGKVAASVEEVDGMREALVQGLPAGGKVDATTFAQICKPVGLRAQAIGKELGVSFVQMSDRFRNPKHKADAAAEGAMKQFQANPELKAFLTSASQDGVVSYRYFRRITVLAQCLACHGAKDARPAFIPTNFPDDRAFGFAAGDLRGVYSVGWTDDAQK